MKYRCAKCALGLPSDLGPGPFQLRPRCEYCQAPIGGQARWGLDPHGAFASTHEARLIWDSLSDAELMALWAIANTQALEGQDVLWALVAALPEHLPELPVVVAQAWKKLASGERGCSWAALRRELCRAMTVGKYGRHCTGPGGDWPPGASRPRRGRTEVIRGG